MSAAALDSPRRFWLYCGRFNRYFSRAVHPYREVLANSVAETDSLPRVTETPAPPRAVPGAIRVARRVWAARGFWLGLLAAGTGAAGMALLVQEKRGPGPGAVLLALAMLLGAVAWSGSRDAPLLARAE